MPSAVRRRESPDPFAAGRSTCAGHAVIPTSIHRRLRLRTCRSTWSQGERLSSIQSSRLNESLVNMRNVRRSLIVGVLLIELVFGAFLLLQKSHRSTADTDVTTNGSVEVAAVSPQSGDTHVIAGSVVGAAPLSGNAATGSGQSTVGAVIPASDSQPVKAVEQAPRPATRARESVAARGHVESKTDPASRTESRSDSLHRHGLNPVASAMTDQLVKQSAGLDPSLPPPPVQPGRNDPYRPGSNPVAAAMTDQLVKESAKLDPSLPPPNQPNLK